MSALGWLRGLFITAAIAAPVGPVEYPAINGVTGALSYAPTTGAFSQAACANLSNGATGCSTVVGTSATVNTGTSGATVALNNGRNSWSAGQVGVPVTVAISTATFTPDLSAGNNFAITLVHASCPCTLANPTNITAGQSGLIVVNQSATGSDTITSYGGDWKWPGGVAPTLSTGASAVDVFSYYVIDATHIALVSQLNFQ